MSARTRSHRRPIARTHRHVLATLITLSGTQVQHVLMPAYKFDFHPPKVSVFFIEFSAYPDGEFPLFTVYLSVVCSR